MKKFPVKVFTNFFWKFFLMIIRKWKPILRLICLFMVAVYISNLLYGPAFFYLSEKTKTHFRSFEGCYSEIGIIPTNTEVEFPYKIGDRKDQVFKSLVDESINNYQLENFIDTNRLFNYGIFVKNTTNIKNWNIKATEPKNTVVPIILETTINEKKLSLSYGQEERIEKKLFKYKDLLGQHQISVVGITLKPEKEESMKGILVGPNEKLEIENLSSEDMPISLQDATERSGYKCLLIFYMKPVDITWWLKLTILSITFIVISLFMIKIWKGILEIYNFILYGKIR